MSFLGLINLFMCSLLNTIRQGDYYLLSDDFDSYMAALDLVDEAYKDKDEWVKKSIRTTAKVSPGSNRPLNNLTHLAL